MYHKMHGYVYSGNSRITDRLTNGDEYTWESRNLALQAGWCLKTPFWWYQEIPYFGRNDEDARR